MSTLKNDLFLRVLKGQPVKEVPVWLMRQAGRYMPEYRQVREQAGSFMNICQTADYIVEVTQQPINAFNLDAGIIFSDILLIPHLMGLGVSFDDGGPRFQKTIKSKTDILGCGDIRYGLGPLTNAIQILKGLLNVPLIGFAGSPFTLACYMLEGRSSTTFDQTNRMLYESPELFSLLIDKNTQAVLHSLHAQIQAGVDVVMLFDSWGGGFPFHIWQQYSALSIRIILAALKRTYPDLPSIVFVKGGGGWLGDIAALGSDAISLDWTVDLSRARLALGDQITLQGNLDPRVLLTTEEAVIRETKCLLKSFYPFQRYVFNLGHGVHRLTPVSHVQRLVETVKMFE